MLSATMSTTVGVIEKASHAPRYWAMMSVVVPVELVTPLGLAHVDGSLMARMPKTHTRAPLNGPFVIRPLSTPTYWPSNRVAVQLSSVQLES